MNVHLKRHIVHVSPRKLNSLEDINDEGCGGGTETRETEWEKMTESERESEYKELMSFAKGKSEGKNRWSAWTPGRVQVRLEGNCHHCGAYGHRMNERRKKDAEMAEHRGTSK